MPTVRYEIRNEFGLGGSKLYGGAKGRDEPEAILEGVAVAGLVGLLKQLGDLAEFASEIFHDLHKEVMATATRGHGLMLRVQQVEAEIPSIEKAFLSQSSQTHFSYNMGTNWHSKRQMDHNLIIREGMPQFIMDSYEECRGPPDLSMLDKYDISGAGACLKRYSDPSFFKAELASSGIMESQVEQEKSARKNKKKGQFRRNGDAPAIFSTPRIESESQLVTSDQASEELLIAHAKLKSRYLIGSDNTNYLELLHQLLSPEGNYLSKNSNSCSDIMMKSIASSESVSEVNGVPFDASADTQKIVNQSPIMDECGMKRQRIMVKELPQILPEHVESTEGSDNDYLPNELQISSSGRQELDKKELSYDNDWRTEDSAGSYSSDDIASDVENYKDALNTMESEVETDCESNVKPNLGVSPINRGMNSGTDNEQELHNQDSMSDIDENSNSVGSISLCKTDTSPTSHSYTSGYKSDAHQPHRNRMALDLPAKLGTCLDETQDITPGQWTNCEVELLSLENFLSGGKCNAKKTHSMSEYREESFNSSSTDSTLSLKHSSANRGPRNTLLVTRNLDEKASDLLKRQYGRMLEIPTSFIEDSPTLSDESTKQVAEVSQGVISKRLHSFSPSKSSISKQIYGAFEETKSFGDSEDDAISPTVEMTHENSNMEPLCNAEESQEPCNMDSTRFIQPRSWKEELHEDMQQSSKASNFSMDAVHTEIVASFEHSSVSNVIIGADSGDHGPCSVLLSATSGFGVCPQEECISDDGVLGQNDYEITEKSVPMGTDKVCTPHIPLCSLVGEAQLISAPIFSNPKLCIPDSSDPSGAKLSNDVCCTAPSELPQIDLNQNNTEKDCINQYGIDKGFSSEASQCCHQESIREETAPSSHLLRDVGQPFEEAPELQSGSMPKIISFENYLALKTDSNQSNPVDPMREPDSDVTANNVSFTEFLKLTQMDWLLNVDPIQNQKGFDSKAPMQISQNAKEGLSLSPCFSVETTNPFEEVSEVQVSTEQGIIPLPRGNELLQPSDLLFESGQFADQENDASNSMVAVNKLLQLEPEEASHHINGMALPPSDMSKCEQQLPDRYVPSQGSYHLHGSLLPSNSSNMAMSIAPGFHLPIPECISQQPDSVCTVTDDAFLKTVEEVPPLPPLPPLEWRTNKLQMGHLAPHLKMAQSSIGQNLLTAMSTTDEKPSHALLTNEGTTIQKSFPFGPLQGSEEDMPQCGSLSHERDSMQSVNLPHMYQNDTLHSEEPVAGAQDVSFVQAAIEDDGHLYGLQDCSGGKVHPLNPFSISDDKSSEHSLSVPISPSVNERSQLDQLSSRSELKRSQHRLSSLEKEIVNPTSHLSVISTSENEPHEPEYKTPGGIAVEEYALDSDNLTTRMLDSEKQNKKLYSLHLCRDPLIEDVASHDKSTLRKVQEPVQPSTKSKIDESGTLLEQIRNKSLNLKPTNSGVKPNLRGPPTNLKIAAILERANAIRQACVGSDDDDDDDDDDDGDSWSDS